MVCLVDENHRGWLVLGEERGLRNVRSVAQRRHNLLVEGL